MHLNVNSLLPKIDELREIVKISNPTVIDITETKLDNSFDDSDISIDADTVPFDVIETERVEVESVTSLMLFATIIKALCKISLSNFLFQKQDQLLLELFINL